MKCKNCKIKIDHKFEHAIRSNVCPGCGKYIMQKANLIAYMELQEIISKNFADVDAEKLANLIISNFDLRTITEDSVAALPEQNEDLAEKNNAKPDIVIEEKTDEDYDQQYKIKQMAKAKKQLAQMKNEVYEDALRAQYGMDEDYDNNIDFDLGDEDLDENPEQRAARLEIESKKSKGRNKMLSGAGGFTRSDV